MSAEPDYVVVRRGPDIPDEWTLPPGLDGKWFDRSETAPPSPEALDRFKAEGGVVSGAAAVPTGRFESRENGAVAEVWELRPRYFPPRPTESEDPR